MTANFSIFNKFGMKLLAEPLIHLPRAIYNVFLFCFVLFCFVFCTEVPMDIKCTVRRLKSFAQDLKQA